jgi:hypothetical protein
MMADQRVWYPDGWTCPHGVNFRKYRCMQCDRKIDWKALAAGTGAAASGKATLKAGPAEVLLNAANVAARGRS